MLCVLEQFGLDLKLLHCAGGLESLKITIFEVLTQSVASVTESEWRFKRCRRVAPPGLRYHSHVMSKFDSLWILWLWCHIEDNVGCIHSWWTHYDVTDCLGVKQQSWEAEQRKEMPRPLFSSLAPRLSPAVTVTAPPPPTLPEACQQLFNTQGELCRYPAWILMTRMLTLKFFCTVCVSAFSWRAAQSEPSSISTVVPNASFAL